MLTLHNCNIAIIYNLLFYILDSYKNNIEIIEI